LVSDANGIDQTTLTYQWQRDGLEIGGETNASLSLTQTDVNALISVRVQFVDFSGTLESVQGLTTTTVANRNDLPQGSLQIQGAPRQGAALNVNWSSLDDDDGIDLTSLAVQWLRDGASIEGANGANYVLNQSDVGAAISVRLTYQDDFGTLETATSAAIQSIENSNDDPQGRVFILGSFETGQALLADTSGLFDADGMVDGSAQFQWYRDGVEITNATGKGYLLEQEDTGALMSVSYLYLDAFGENESVTGTSSVRVTAGGDPATIPVAGHDGAGDQLGLHGALGLNGTPVQNQLISVDFSAFVAADYITSDLIQFQWLSDGNLVSGATGDRYLVDPAYVGTGLSVRITFRDAAGISHSVESESKTILSNPREVEGTGFQDNLFGFDGDDIIFAKDGDDMLISSAGNDVLNGGAGIDTAIFAGDQASYTLRLGKLGTTLVDRKEHADGGQGSSDLISIENLNFGKEIEPFEGGAVPLGFFEKATQVSGGDLASITELYVAYFNRAPDAIGLTYWASRFAEGADLASLANSFFRQPETRSEYAEMLSADGNSLDDVEGFVTAVYANVLGRAPDPEGFSYWVNQLQNQPNVEPATFILSVLAGAKFPAEPNAQATLDRAFIETKTDIGTYFAAIKGLSNVDGASDVMALFDGTVGGLASAIGKIDDAYADALDAYDGEFLMQLIGVSNDISAEFF
jgi:hypothetical protein